MKESKREGEREMIIERGLRKKEERKKVREKERKI